MQVNRIGFSLILSALFLFAIPAAASAALSLKPANNLPAGGNPTSVAIGDLNEDGLKDLASSNFNGQSVTIRFGTGNGSFGPATTLPRIRGRRT